ncbi:TIGR03620 family F420-dependent LLM class oxidoreductase [Candidatus Poriferisocius sp.]|uniref:TIGR03620 family F420-dependent LLM class oxidoreductase n=1 Tax=Candidatus Poriferisocius sp. TaxID=3101276 RepID=UPI003B02098E
MTGPAPQVSGGIGLWFGTNLMEPNQAAEFAARVESLGYSALWLPETTHRDPFAHIAFLATQTDSLVFATGIASIFHRHPGAMKQAAMTVAEQSNDRLIVGLGVSHAPMVSGVRKLDYTRPLSQMRDYLDGMDEAPYSGAATPQPPLVLAALGPKMLQLAADRSDGAHPYWTTPEHTELARSVLGPDKLLCVEQKVVLTSEADEARSKAREAVDLYADLPNYRNNWIRLGFSDDEINHRSTRLLDGLVAWGSAERINERVQAHYDAGASHVCIQPIAAGRFGTLDEHTLEGLAPG